VSFADGPRAAYGFGLARGTELGRAVTGHGGALRGWRSHRLYSPTDRVSVVVMFNHLSDAHAAAVDAFAAVLGEARPAPTPASAATAPSWLGAYLEPETGLLTRIAAAASGQVSLRFGHHAERLGLDASGGAAGQGLALRAMDDGLWMDRPHENLSSRLRSLGAPGAPNPGARDIAGRYACRELEAELTISDAGGVLYGGFSGFLGQGRMEQLEPIGAGVWTLPCPRALDHTPPGDWTLRAEHEGGAATAIHVGCWLARGLVYERVD
jgi:D-aminopeptidase